MEVVYTHLFYIPLVLSGIWFYRKALWTAAFLSFFHISANILFQGTILSSTIIRSVMFFLIAFMVGYLTEKKDEAENILLNIKGELEEKIIERTRELESVNSQLQQELLRRKQEEETLKNDITDLKQTEEQLIYLSYHDSMTGLYNRTFFEEELKRVDNGQQLPLSIIMGDVNGLKLVNDAFGHDQGDKLLKKLANILKSSCRQGDVISRWGGDEFAVLLTNTDESTANRISNRIRKSCSEAAADPIQLSISLGVATKEKLSQEIYMVIKEAENKMYKYKLMDSKNIRSSVVFFLLETLKERTYETEEHILNIQNFALKMGNLLNLPEKVLENLTLLAELHDIGKIAISDSILRNIGNLSDEEFEIMCKHPETGYRISNFSPGLAHISEAILAHHERWDGMGYPQGLKREEIPLISRIIAICDYYDVITRGNNFEKALSKEEAFEEILMSSGSKFDPELVDIFLSILNSSCLVQAK
ncbi:bifunctional diguanylate cyclase/phosphohydrolase [Candidatus Contubernalis alkaliaceticus]|uniref:bifunctional diguanylate cyclase/phosphohydrolase n=1 Tax=Candidatus Contubernalis alkaliaceticus TaxID=338645 RepID=UPI001F4BCEF1|nr:diguanylate cyclase [Candidatus Contubernalis alkalaceticus]UNC91941.1 diguanylate cyclase [Candidatus Contubernalis alkalaceticus]